MGTVGADGSELSMRTGHIRVGNSWKPPSPNKGLRMPMPEPLLPVSQEREWVVACEVKRCNTISDR